MTSLLQKILTPGHRAISSRMILWGRLTSMRKNLQNHMSNYPFRENEIQMFIKVSLLFILIFVLSFAGCNSKRPGQDKIEAQKVESLIKIKEVNDLTIIIQFGYDAVTAIKTSKGIVLVDAGISTDLTARYKKIIEDKFRQKNFVYVINSHGHRDHIRGNSLFHQAKVVGHEYCQKDAFEGWNNQASSLMRIRKIVNDYDQELQHSIPNTSEWEDSFTQKIRYMGAYQDTKNRIPLRIPDITFSDSLKCECGGSTFEMMYFGKFHSNSDILIYIPETKVLFTGDLFSKYGRPNKSDSSVADKSQWIRATKWIKRRKDSIETIIDGHGHILSTDDLASFNDNLLSKYLKEGIK